MDIQEKALRVIEFIACEAGHEDIENKALSTIYQAAHVALDYCLAPHDDWKERLEEIYQELIDEGVFESPADPMELP